MAEEAKEGQEAPPKKGKKFILFIILAVFLILGIATASFILLSAKKTEDSEQASKKAKKPKELIIVDYEPIIVNLFDPSGKRYLQIRISIEVTDKKAEEELKKQEAKLKDAIIFLIGGKTVEEVVVPEAKEKIKKEILLKCKELFGEEMISNVYITQYIVE